MARITQYTTTLWISAVFFLAHASQSLAANQDTAYGYVSYVRTYQINGGLRAEIGLSGISHTCGTLPNIIDFDTDKVSADVVKATIALAFGALAADKQIQVTYDCSYGGGYGWGVALRVVS